MEAEVVAADGAGFALTQVEIELDYDTQDFEVFTHRYDCDADSPAGWVGVSWVEDACQPTGYELSDDRSQITAATEGEFHAVVGSAHGENGDSEHTSRAKIVGDSDGYVGSCRWTPSDIEDYEVVFFHVFPAGVRLECLVNGG